MKVKNHDVYHHDSHPDVYSQDSLGLKIRCDMKLKIPYSEDSIRIKEMKSLLFIFTLLPLLSLAQLNNYSANELDSLQYIENRPVLFFINTDWCSICLAMESKVLNSEAISKELNENYYLVILNAGSSIQRKTIQLMKQAE